MIGDRLRVLAVLPVAAVAVFGGIVSYSHIFGLAVRTGQAGQATVAPAARPGLLPTCLARSSRPSRI